MIKHCFELFVYLAESPRLCVNVYIDVFALVSFSTSKQGEQRHPLRLNPCDEELWTNAVFKTKLTLYFCNQLSSAAKK